MTDKDVLRVLAASGDPCLAIYAVVRRERRPFGIDLIDQILTTGIAGSLRDVALAAGPRRFLVVGAASARLVTVEAGVVGRVIELPDWQRPPSKPGRVVTVEGTEYLVGARLT